MVSADIGNQAALVTGNSWFPTTCVLVRPQFKRESLADREARHPTLLFLIFWRCALKRDSDLAGLRRDTRWATLVARFEAESKSNKARWESKAFRSSYRDNLADADKATGLGRSVAPDEDAYADHKASDSPDVKRKTPPLGSWHML